MNFCLYDTGGRIDAVLTVPDEETARLQGMKYVACDVDTIDTTHYVDLSGRDPVVKEKSPLDTPYNVYDLVVVFPSLPKGLLVDVDGQELVTDGGYTEIEFELPGTYTIRLSGLVKYLDETLEVAIG